MGYHAYGAQEGVVVWSAVWWGLSSRVVVGRFASKVIPRISRHRNNPISISPFCSDGGIDNHSTHAPSPAEEACFLRDTLRDGEVPACAALDLGPCLREEERGRCVGDWLGSRVVDAGPVAAGEESCLSG